MTAKVKHTCWQNLRFSKILAMLELKTQLLLNLQMFQNPDIIYIIKEHENYSKLHSEIGILEE